ncbi:hypothetical protein [Nocardiopsis sp. NPDC055824]
MHDPYGDLDPNMEPLWLLDPALDALLLDNPALKTPPSLQSLRRAAARVIDMAATLTPQGGRAHAH